MDNEMKLKISDLGLARIFKDSETPSKHDKSDWDIVRVPAFQLCF